MDTYGIIGYPLGHSFSRKYFNEKFSNEKIDAEYLNFELTTIDDLPSVIAGHPHLKGLNVTIPYKEKVISYLDTLDKTALAVGAVNVIKVIRQKGSEPKLVGYNSDTIGFMQSIETLLDSHHKKALVLGTGGAAKAVHYGLRQLGVEPTYVSRHARPNMYTYAELTPEVMSEHTVIVNCTPVGMYPNTEECANIPYDLVTPRHLLYDVIYNPDQTLFMRRGAAQGATTKNGVEMLLMQAFAAWEIWNS